MSIAADVTFVAPDHFAPGFVRNPYPALAEARREAPIYHLPELDLWVVTRHADIRTVLSDAETFSNANTQKPLFALCPQSQRVLAEGGFAPAPSLTALDGERHQKLRRRFMKGLGLTPARLSALEPSIAAQCREMIAPLVPLGRADLVASVLQRIPARVIFRLIGFPEHDHEQLLAWCADRLRMFWGRVSAEEQVENAAGMVSYWRYCTEFVAAAHAAPQDDVTGDLVRLQSAHPDEITDLDVASFVFGLIFAGQETTPNAMAAMVRLLLETEGAWERLRADRSGVPGAFEEALRLEPPIAAWRRVVARDTELGGTRLAAGAQLLLHLGSAGHDEAAFMDPEAFDPGRGNSSDHMAFGSGKHFCLGAPLARLEARIVINALLDHLPGLSLDPAHEIAYPANIAFRGPLSLHVRWPVPG